MEQRAGRAVRVRHATRTTTAGYVYFGNAASPQVETVHETVLSLGDAAVEISMPRPIHIDEGNEVLVAGERRADGVFVACAYVNRSKRIVGRPEDLVARQTAWLLLALAGLLTPAVAFWARDLFGFSAVGWLAVIAAAIAAIAVGSARALSTGARRRELRQLLTA